MLKMEKVKLAREISRKVLLAVSSPLLLSRGRSPKLRYRYEGFTQMR